MNQATENELEHKILFINRCSKVLKGGRRFSFSAIVIVGNGEGLVGYGFGKAKEIADAVAKAKSQATRNAIQVKLEGSTVPHEVRIKQNGVHLMIKPAKKGSGVIAGSYVRSVLELAGIKDIVAKNLTGNNPMNQVIATFRALSAMKTNETVYSARGIH